MKSNDLERKILDSREHKYREIQFLKKSFKTVISIKTNIPGLRKQLNISYLLVNCFKKLIPFDMVDHSVYYDGYDGPYFLIGSNREPNTVKSYLVGLEEEHYLGRFIDLDVFDGEKVLSRGKMRKCYLCESDAFVCMREGRHNDTELISIMESTIKKFFKMDALQKINDSILEELNLHPKFGLVTPYTSGSHRDMNYELMIKAKDSILPFLGKMFEVGYDTTNVNIIFSLIRKIGIDAEKEMLDVTNGINAYKGLIFNMGIIAAAYAYTLYNNIGIDKLIDQVKNITASILCDFNNEGESFGMNAYRLYSFTGARGEAADGFPSARIALNELRNLSDTSKLRALIRLISISQDTVLLKRTGGIEEYNRTRYLFEKLLNNKLSNIDEINLYCIERGLSFGGSADLLVLTIFLKKIGFNQTN